MGRKSREKRVRKSDEEERKKKVKKRKDGEVDRFEVGLTSGDLRLLDAHVENFRKGVKEAEAALLLLGRDASAVVMQIAEKRKDAALLEFGKRLVAVKPRVETNMFALRRASVEAIVEAHKKGARALDDQPSLTFEGPAIALFDPIRVADALVRGGRPRADLSRIGQGDIAWFGLGDSPTKVDLGAQGDPPESALELRLTVESGLVFVGPPEAADGPRFGTVRLDPFRTTLDDHLEKARFLKVPAGRYAVHAWRTGGGKVRIRLAEAPDEAPLELPLSRLNALLAP